MEAYADGETQIGATQTFEVVHLVAFATADLRDFDTDADDRFLRNLPEGECIVDDFPVIQRTDLAQVGREHSRTSSSKTRAKPVTAGLSSL